MRQHTSRHQAGFTIIELMVATLIFSLVLLVITFGVLQFTRSYYRGTTTTNLQETARSVVDTISQTIQLSGVSLQSAGSPVSTYCIGGRQYDFKLHTRVTSASDHVLYSTPSPAGGSCTPITTFAGNSRDLVDRNMRVVKFSITPQATTGVGEMYKINLRIAFGEDDLLCSPSAGDCSSDNVSTHLDNDDLTCKVANGSQFCAVTELSTIVQKRIQ